MARDFNSSGDNLSYTAVSAQTSLTTITIAAWIYARSAGLNAGDPYGRIFIKRNRYSFYVDGDGASPTIGFTAGRVTTNGDWSPAVGSIAYNAWYHVAVTYDSGSTSNDPIIYVNGADAGLGNYDSNGTGAINGDNSQLKIGNSGSNNATFDGYIAEVGYWNRILTAAEVAILADAYPPSAIRNGLVFYAPLVRDVTDLRHSAAVVDTGTAVVAHPRMYTLFANRGRRFTTAAVAPGGSTWPGYIGGGWF